MSSSRSTRGDRGTHAAELARSYLTIVKDVSRVMSRLKASIVAYRSWAIPVPAGRSIPHRGDAGKIRALDQSHAKRTDRPKGSALAA